MIGRLDPFPAYLKGRRWDVLAANRAAWALFADWPARAPGDRNHPALGDVAFQHAVLQVADHPEQLLVYFTTADVPESALESLLEYSL